ncbi:MAG: hypothetical protein KDJ90_22310, partial [Nitratireductor sp.]|nr:hypothetical protein [Nitratireductor sp.]
MASEPKKDSASETALRAVEDALNIDFTEGDAPAGGKSARGEVPDTDPDFLELEQRLADAANDLRRQSDETDVSMAPAPARPRPTPRGRRNQQPEPARASRGQKPGFSPANDDRSAGGGDLSFAIQRTPPTRIFWVAAFLSLVWLGLTGGLYVYARDNGVLTSLFGTSEAMSGPVPWVLGGIILVPMLLIWAFAIMMRRAQEMRVAAQTMTEAAVRLLRPEDTAAASVATVGRAIRREVAAINDGMERAIARASELERFVQSEMGNLERSYADAEVRLKGLVGELAEERHEIVSHVDLLRDSLADTHTGITNEVDAVASRIEAAVLATTSRIVDSIDTEGLAVTGKLENVTGRLSEMLSQSGSQIAEAVSLRASDFDRMVQDRVSDLDSTVEERLTHFGSLLDGRIEDLFNKLGNQQKNVETVTSRVEQLVDEQIGKAGKEFGTRGMALVRALGAQTKALDKAMEDRTEKIGSVMGGRLAELGASVSGHVDTVMHQLQERSGALETTATRIEQAISHNVGRLDDNLRQHALEVARSFTTGSDIINGVLDDAMDGISAKALEAKLGIESVQSEMTTAMDERITAMTSSLNSGHRRMVDELDKMDNRSTGLVAEIDKRTERMGEMLLKAGTTLAGVIDARSTTIENSLTHSQQRLVEELDKMDERSTVFISEIDKRTERMGDLVSRAGTSLAGMMDERSEAIQHTILEGQRRLAEELDKMDDRSTGLVSEIDKRAEQMGVMVARAGSSLAGMMDERSEAIQRTIIEGQRRLAEELDKMDNRSTGLVSEIDKRAEHMGEMVARAGSNLAGIIDQRSEAIQRSLVEGQQRLVVELDKMDNRSTGLVTEIDKRSKAMSDSIVAAGTSMLSQFDERNATLRQSMDWGYKQLFEQVEVIDQRNTKLLTDMEKQVERVGSSVRQANTDLTATFESGVSLLRQNIGEGQKQIFGEIEHLNTAGAKLVDEISARTNLLGETMGNAAQHISGVIDERNKSIFATLRQGRDEFLSEIEATSHNLMAGLDAKRNEFDARLQEQIELSGRQIDSKAESLSNLLTERARAINTSLGGELLETQRALETRTREFSQALAERAREIGTVIDEHGLPVVEGLRSGGIELVNEIERVGGTLSKEFLQLFEKMATATGNFDTMANQAGSSLSTLERHITEGTAQLAETIQRAAADSENTRQTVERTVAEVSQTTEELLAGMSESSQRFDKQVKQLNAASEAVTTSQKQLAAVLDARQEPLEELAANISERSSAIEHSVLNFSGVLTSLIQDMMDKANKAGSQVTAEIENSFDQAISRLAETVEAMRVASEDIRNELESTRTQMRRGVMELPVEVKESADSMRRVLVDQISALKELSEIVTKSGKAYDMAPPVQQPRLAAAGGGVPAPTMRAATVSQPVQLETVRAPAPDMNEAAPIAFEEPRPRPRVVPDNYEAPAPREPASERGSEREQGAEARQQARRPVDPMHRGGSRGGAERRPPAPPKVENASESLNTLSMDIARAIDHDSAADVWERYQRGENNVFTRDLYTPRGQKTFDEIRSKYKGESEFRAAVDRYIVDFERLLKDVGRNDRDNVMTQTYLTSDTGKVYTML